jgi:catechol 2,3-dioxygenase-like lactoylglutathione lyase family enzyme
LESVLFFFEKNFGLEVLRHEEFAEGCKATCNGPYGGAWSKTMVGSRARGGEKGGFALELTHNYGIGEYARGNDLRYLEIFEDGFIGDETNLICSEDDKFAQMPDGHFIKLVPRTVFPGEEGDTPREIFKGVSLHVSDLKSSISFYESVLEAECVSSDAQHATFSFGSGSQGDGDVLVELHEAPGGWVDRAEASGRFAIETNDGAPSSVAERAISKGFAENILHGPIKLQPHNEEVAIIQDLDGGEYCFVEARGFNACIMVGFQDGGAVIDWEYRQGLERTAQENMNMKVSYPDPVVTIEAEKFGETVAAADAHLVEFFLPWCVRCSYLKTMVERIALRLARSKTLRTSVKMAVLNGADAKKARLFASLHDATPGDDDLHGEELDSLLQFTKDAGFPQFFLITRDATVKHYDGPVLEEPLFKWFLDNAELSPDVHSQLEADGFPAMLPNDPYGPGGDLHPDTVDLQRFMPSSERGKKAERISLDDDCGDCEL